MSEVTTTTTLGERVTEEIRVALARRRLSATELAQRMGVSQSYLARRMTGAQPLSLDDLQRIATALGVNVVDLIPRPDGGHLAGSPIDPLAPRVIATGGEPRARRAVRLPRQYRPANRVEVLA